MADQPVNRREYANWVNANSTGLTGCYWIIPSSLLNVYNVKLTDGLTTRFTMGNEMYIHKEIQKVVLPLLEKYDLELIDLIGEMNHAAWELSVLNKAGIKNLIAELNEVSNV